MPANPATRARQYSIIVSAHACSGNWSKPSRHSRKAFRKRGKSNLKPEETSPDLFTRAESAAAFVLSETKLRPQIGLVLGSGLGAFADELSEAIRIPYEHIPT